MKRKNWSKRKGSYFNLRTVLLSGLLVAIGGAVVAHTLLQNVLVLSNNEDITRKNDRRSKLELIDTSSYNQKQQKRHYPEWRRIAVELAQLPPLEALRILETNDPFGVRTFDSKLKEIEQKNNDGTKVEPSQLQQLFACNSNDRISLPDQRNQTRATEFRNSDNTPHNTFLYFQHLRKAGGTNFCTLAEANFKKEQLPPYFCMPDYHWPHLPSEKQEACAGCLHHWTNHEITSFMKHHRIAGNEWDSFDVEHHFDLPAIFVTSFRKPVDRALSQFRFECVEERGCKIKNVDEWWKNRRDLYNIYTWTFSDVSRLKRISIDDKFAKERGVVLGTALDTISKFHLVLVMEWLQYAESAVQTVLGFSDTSALQQKVRPHNYVQRQDTWSAEQFLDTSEYQEFRKYLALDEILTDAARRFFLERLVCNEP